MAEKLQITFPTTSKPQTLRFSTSLFEKSLQRNVVNILSKQVYSEAKVDSDTSVRMQ